MRASSKSYTLEDANQDLGIWMRSQPDFSGGRGPIIKSTKTATYTGRFPWHGNKQRAPEDYFVPLIHPVTGKALPGS